MAEKGLGIKLKMPGSAPLIAEEDTANFFSPSPESKPEMKPSLEKRLSKTTRGRKKKIDRLPSSPLFKPGRSSFEGKFGRQKFSLTADKFYNKNILKSSIEANDGTAVVTKSERYLSPSYARGVHSSSNSSSSSPQHDPYAHFTYVLRLASGQEEEPDIVMMDHCYSLPWHRQIQSTFAWPRKVLFVSKLTNSTKLTSSNYTGNDIVVDDAPPTPPQLPYDVQKARQVMGECERHVVFAKLDRVRGTVDLKAEEGQDDEDEVDCSETIQRTGWTEAQNELFDKAISILDADRLARLALKDTHNEPAKRRVFIDKTAAKYRKMLGKIRWDVKLSQWLHGQLIQNLSTSYLTAYLDVLQTMKSKIPSLVDKMILLSSSHRGPSTEALNLLLKRPWDPAVPVLSQHKPRKLDGSPIIIQVPSNASSVKLPQTSRRIRFFNTQLQHLAKSLPVSVHPDCTDASGILDHLMLEVRNKVVECKTQYPGHPIVLLGWGVGAVLATNVSMVENVNANICLGYPISGCTGKRGEVDDPLMESKTPTLFIIGEKSSNSSIDDMEDIRHNMKVETGLVVIAGGDSLLRVSWEKRYWEGLTQSMVDRCIVDEIGDFLTQLWSKTNSTTTAPSSHTTLSYASVSSPTTTTQSSHYTTPPASSFMNPLPPKTQKKEVGRKRKLSPDSSPSSPKLSQPSAFTSQQVNTVGSSTVNMKIPVGVSALSTMYEGGDSSHYQFNKTLSSTSSDQITFSQDIIGPPPKKRGRRPGESKKKTSPIIKPNVDAVSPTVVKRDEATSFTMKDESTSPISANTISLGSLASVTRQKYQRMIQLSSSPTTGGNEKGLFGRSQTSPSEDHSNKVNTSTTTHVANQMNLTSVGNVTPITGWNIKGSLGKSLTSGFHPITPIDTTPQSSSVIIGTPTIESSDGNSGETTAISGVSLDDLSALESQTADIRNEPIIEVFGTFEDEETKEDVEEDMDVDDSNTGSALSNFKTGGSLRVYSGTVQRPVSSSYMLSNQPTISTLTTLSTATSSIITSNMSKTISLSNATYNSPIITTSSIIFTSTTPSTTNLTLGSSSNSNKGRIILTSSPRVIKPLGNVKAPGIRNIISAKTIKPSSTQESKGIRQTLMLMPSSSTSTSVIKTIVTSAPTSSVKEGSPVLPSMKLGENTQENTSSIQTDSSPVISTDQEIRQSVGLQSFGKSGVLSSKVILSSSKISKQNKQGIITKTFTLSSSSTGKSPSKFFSLTESKGENKQGLDNAESSKVFPANASNSSSVLKLSSPIGISREDKNTGIAETKPCISSLSNLNIIKTSITELSNSIAPTMLQKPTGTSLLSSQCNTSISLSGPISSTVDPALGCSPSTESSSFSIKVDLPKQTPKSSVVVLSPSSSGAKSQTSRSLNTSTITVLSSTKPSGTIITLSSSSKPTGQLTNIPSNMITSHSRPTVGTNLTMKPTIGSIITVPSTKMSVASSLNPVTKFITGSINSTSGEVGSVGKKTSANKIYPLRVVPSSRVATARGTAVKLATAEKQTEPLSPDALDISQEIMCSKDTNNDNVSKNNTKQDDIESESPIYPTQINSDMDDNSSSVSHKDEDKTTTAVTLELSPKKSKSDKSTLNSEFQTVNVSNLESVEVSIECSSDSRPEDSLKPAVITRSRKSSSDESTSKGKSNKSNTKSGKKSRTSLSGDKKSLRSNTILTPDYVRGTRLSVRGKGKKNLK